MIIMAKRGRQQCFYSFNAFYQLVKMAIWVKTMYRTEAEVVGDAMRVLTELFSKVGETRVNKEVELRKGRRVDFLVTLKTGNKTVKVVCEVKALGEPRIISQTAVQLNEYSKLADNAYPVFVAPYVSERGREVCKSLGIGFVDLVGNAYLKFGSVFIEKFAKEAPKREQRLLKSIFAPKATRVIRKMLAMPEKKWTLQPLADAAGVSLAQAFKVVKKLESQNFATREEGKIRLINPGELLNLWAQAHDFSKNKITGYYTREKGAALFNKLAELAKKKRLRYGLTLMAGASLVAPFVRSSDVHLYIAKNQKQWVDQLDLEEVEFGGNVFLIQPADEGVFFDMQEIDGIKVVSNLQIYLDLVKYPARGKEQAEFLRKEKMKF